MMRILACYLFSFLAGCSLGFQPTKRVGRCPTKGTSSQLLAAKQPISTASKFWLPLALSSVVALNPLPQNNFHPENALAAVEQVGPSSVTTLTFADNNSRLNHKFVLTRQTARSGPIMDLAGVLSTEDQLTILDEVSQAESTMGTEIQIIVTDQISSDTSPKQLATALFNKWRLGPSDKNNGVLILAVLDQRRVEIEVGRGIGSQMNAAWCSQTLQEVTIPSFRQGDYGQGILNAVRRISQKLEDVDYASRRSRPSPYVTDGAGVRSSPRSALVVRRVTEEQLEVVDTTRLRSSSRDVADGGGDPELALGILVGTMLLIGIEQENMRRIRQQASKSEEAPRPNTWTSSSLPLISKPRKTKRNRNSRRQSYSGDANSRSRSRWSGREWFSGDSGGSSSSGSSSWSSGGGWSNGDSGGSSGGDGGGGGWSSGDSGGSSDGDGGGGGWSSGDSGGSSDGDGGGADW